LVNTMGKYLTPFQRKLLEQELQRTDLAKKYRQRIEIILLADQGKSQSEICQDCQCAQSTARYWIRVGQEGQAHTWNQEQAGRPPKVTDAYREILRNALSQSPRNFGYAFRHWTADKLIAHLQKETGITIGKRQMYRLLEAEGLSTRPKSISTVLESHSLIILKDLQASLESLSPPE
jgi:transposase